MIQNLPAKAGDPSSVPGAETSAGEGNGSPFPIFLPGKSHEQWSLVGYSPWGHRRVRHFLSTKQQQQQALSSKNLRLESSVTRVIKFCELLID